MHRRDAPGGNAEAKAQVAEVGRVAPPGDRVEHRTDDVRKILGDVGVRPDRRRRRHRDRPGLQKPDRSRAVDRPFDVERLAELALQLERGLGERAHRHAEILDGGARVRRRDRAAHLSACPRDRDDSGSHVSAHELVAQALAVFDQHRRGRAPCGRAGEIRERASICSHTITPSACKRTPRRRW